MPGLDVVDHAPGAGDAVLVKAPAPPRTAEPGSAQAVDIAPARLRRHGPGGEHGMGVVAPHQDALGIDALGLVERNDEVPAALEVLQPVHVVGNPAASVFLAIDENVPG